jgi:hypothetical protein
VVCLLPLTAVGLPRQPLRPEYANAIVRDVNRVGF